MVIRQQKVRAVNAELPFSQLLFTTDINLAEKYKPIRCLEIRNKLQVLCEMINNNKKKTSETATAMYFALKDRHDIMSRHLWCGASLMEFDTETFQ